MLEYEFLNHIIDDCSVISLETEVLSIYFRSYKSTQYEKLNGYKTEGQLIIPVLLK